MLHDYICMSNIKARAKIIEYKNMLNDNCVYIFDKKVDTKKIEREMQKLEQMKYCKDCKLRDTCVMYQTRDIKGEKKWK